jgi:sulfur carrier protein
MQLTVNGKPQEHEVRTTGDLLNALKIGRERVAVVVNEQVVRRMNLDDTTLKDGDVVEVITMVGGG